MQDKAAGIRKGTVLNAGRTSKDSSHGSKTIHRKKLQEFQRLHRTPTGYHGTQARKPHKTTEGSPKNSKTKKKSHRSHAKVTTLYDHPKTFHSVGPTSNSYISTELFGTITRRFKTPELPGRTH